MAEREGRSGFDMGGRGGSGVSSPPCGPRSGSRGPAPRDGSRSGSRGPPRRLTPSSPLGRHVGTVSRWDPDRGFGWIQPSSTVPSDGSEVFCHASAFGGGRLEPGAEVEFEYMADEEGRHRAGAVRGPGVHCRSDPTTRPEPPSTDRIAELEQFVVSFARSGDGQTAMPTNLSGTERKAVHAAAKREGLVSQSVGSGFDRTLWVMRPPAGRARREHFPPVDGAVSISVVELTSESTAKLQRRFSTNVPRGWVLRGERLKLCRGPLSEAANWQDCRDVADAVGDQVRSLRPGDPVALRVVAIGRDTENTIVTAAALGCPCCFRTPQITLAHHPDARPRERHMVFSSLRDGDIVTVMGHVRELERTAVPSPEPSPQSSPRGSEERCSPSRRCSPRSARGAPVPHAPPCHAPPRGEPRQEGTVRFWSEDRGFGFVRTEDDPKGLFVHHSCLTGGRRSLQEGWLVSFVAGEGRDGKPRATRVVVEEERDPAQEQDGDAEGGRGSGDWGWQQQPAADNW
eukprot:TRINITY_DN25487_c0_g1_i1.p1 TRINITY_DN25487_c0_g1~~TRINITY_DN25487_c0_g1_i1.p1  ORF type:complete len:540 (+),score=89.15 TRINITY_DN25487_c0_g1_i1:80-1621(+)